MNIILKKITNPDYSSNLIYILSRDEIVKINFLNHEELEYLNKQLGLNNTLIKIPRTASFLYIIIFNKENNLDIENEKIRKNASIVEQELSKNIESKCQLISTVSKDVTTSVIEGFVLSAYRFVQYFRDVSKKVNSISELSVCSELSDADLLNISSILKGVYIARDFVNEPVITLNAVEFADRIKALSEDANFEVTIRNKEWIEANKMGGILAVNRGSIDPPCFVEIKWQPKGSLNTKPIILVGKGIVFDTGGLSLKSTANMDYMKSDMGGAATSVGVMYALAKNNIPINIISYIPITDNRPNGNAYVPGDVVKMHNGIFVEVLNTDAEGRMILADALSYAQKDNPLLVVDIATLTGSASMAVGEHAVVAMGTAEQSYFDELNKSGHKVCERIVQFPIWEEYGEYIKSEIADIKNVGGTSAGAIIAAKFLEHFIFYPWIHLDISGSSFYKSRTNYRTVGGTGFGVRLLYEFFCNIK